MDEARFLPGFSAGYRGNPFRVPSEEEWQALALLPDSVERALATGHVVQLLGERGRGKSTTLRAIAARWETMGAETVLEYMKRGRSRFATNTAGLEAFLLDESQRLANSERTRLAAAAADGRFRLAFSSHEDLTPCFRRRGVTVVTCRLDDTAAALAPALIERRLAFYARPGASRARLTPPAVAAVVVHFGGDLREMMAFLYEIFAGLTGPAAIGVAQLQPALSAAGRG